MNLSNALLVPSKAAACSPALPGCNAAYPQRPPHGFLLRNVEKGIVKGENLFVRLEHESSSRRSVLHIFWRLWQQRLHGWCNTCQAHRGLPPENRQVSGVTAVPSYHIYRERGRVLYIYIYIYNHIIIYIYIYTHDATHCNPALCASYHTAEPLCSIFRCPTCGSAADSVRNS